MTGRLTKKGRCSVNEADRADCYEAEDELFSLDVGPGFDWELLENRFFNDMSNGARYLAENSGLSPKEAKALLRRVYRM
jgi:hypothetical protein